MTMSVTMSTPTPAARTKQSAPLLLSIPDSPREAPETEYQRIFARFVARMEEASEEDLQDSAVAHVGLEGVEPTPGLLAWAEATRAALEDVKRKREAHIQAMYDQLEALWRRLGVPDADMDAFVEAQRGSTDETVRAYEEELERMLELKRESMSKFIANARAEIEALWDDVMAGEDERGAFGPMVDDEHTEELLTLHEQEIQRLREERALKAPILTSLRKYYAICDEDRELAAASADQSRLLGRGVRGDPGRLLREEKMRKRVQTKPKVHKLHRSSLY